jgi:hypothetical protein
MDDFDLGEWTIALESRPDAFSQPALTSERYESAGTPFRLHGDRCKREGPIIA